MAHPPSTDLDGKAAWLNHNRRIALVAGVCALATIGLMLGMGPIRQPLAYHAFSDARTILGIPNAFNVVSNLPFLLIGVAGLARLSTRPANLAPLLHVHFMIVFAGLAATAFGSAYYHWAPTSQTLFWDRLPIAVAFMALYAAVFGERISLASGRWLLWPLVLFGAGSAIYWSLTDDLRPYLLAQFLPLLTIPLIIWLFPARYTRGGDVLISIGFYAVAKVFEDMDGAVFRALQDVVSGHTLKHLAAAIGAFWILRMLRLRTAIKAQGVPDPRQAL